MLTPRQDLVIWADGLNEMEKVLFMRVESVMQKYGYVDIEMLCILTGDSRQYIQRTLKKIEAILDNG